MGLLLLHHDRLSGTGQSGETKTCTTQKQTNREFSVLQFQISVLQSNRDYLSSFSWFWVSYKLPSCVKSKHFERLPSHHATIQWLTNLALLVSSLISLYVWRAWWQPWWTCIPPHSGVKTAGSSSSWQWPWCPSSWGSSCWRRWVSATLLYVMFMFSQACNLAWTRVTVRQVKPISTHHSFLYAALRISNIPIMFRSVSLTVWTVIAKYLPSPSYFFLIILLQAGFFVFAGCTSSV